MERNQRWQDWVMLVLGIWLFFSPFIMQAGTYGGLMAWNAYIMGVAVVFFALAALTDVRKWEEWVNLVLGAWMIISPFALGFYAEHALTYNNIVLGLLIGGDAIWALLRKQPPMHHPAVQ